MEIKNFLICLLFLSLAVYAGNYENFSKLSNQRRGEMFRNGAYVSKTGSMTALIGTGVIISGLLIKSDPLASTGSILFAIGLPAHGLGTLKMRKAATPGAGISPNGWYWYATAWVFKATYLTTALLTENPYKGLFYGAMAGDAVCSLASWVKFSSYRNRLVKNHPELHLRIRPAMHFLKDAKPQLGIAVSASF